MSLHRQKREWNWLSSVSGCCLCKLFFTLKSRCMCVSSFGLCCCWWRLCLNFIKSFTYILYDNKNKNKNTNSLFSFCCCCSDFKLPLVYLLFNRNVNDWLNMHVTKLVYSGITVCASLWATWNVWFQLACAVCVCVCLCA